MRAVWKGTILAESDDTIQVEGNHYFPRDSIRMEHLAESDTTSFCGWKGTARYYTARVAGEANEDCAWYYAEPNDAAEKIRDMVAFWKGVEITEA